MKLIPILPVEESDQDRRPQAPRGRLISATAVDEGDGEDALILEWIEKIEGYKGPVARRNALQKGLKALSSAGARQRLTLEASKIEVNAVLDKVDGLTSTNAKRRHLAKAIEDLENDDVPDDLQAEELKLLQSALEELE